MTTLTARVSTAPLRATRTRFGVVGMMLAMAMVTYLDRVCIGTAAPQIRADLGLNAYQMGWIFTIFSISYGLFEIPTAWWADRQGTRSVLTRIVVWWSVFTMATAAAFNWVSMLVIRFLFGAGEAGAWPCMARTFARWIPVAERGRIQGIFFAGAHLAGAVTPVIVLTMMKFVSWRWIFVIFGCVGIVWALAWYKWFRNEPSEHPGVNAAELEKITSGRRVGATHHAGWAYWKRLLTSRATVALCLAYMPTATSFYFCITWLPTFLQEKHGFAAAQLGLLSGLPLFLAVFSDIFGGVATDSAVKRFGLRLGRVGVCVLGYTVAGAAMLNAAYTSQPVVAAVSLSIAVAAAMFTLGASWGMCLDIGGEQVAVVSAAMNTAGVAATIPTPVLIAWLVEKFGDWNAPLVMMGWFFFIGVVCWLMVDPRKQIFEDAKAA